MPRQRRKGSCRSLATRTSSPATPSSVPSTPLPLPRLFLRRCYSSVRPLLRFFSVGILLVSSSSPFARPRSAGICFRFIKSRLYTPRVSLQVRLSLYWVLRIRAVRSSGESDGVRSRLSARIRSRLKSRDRSSYVKLSAVIFRVLGRPF